ncbi:MAG: NAD(P)-dependent oxidoreductase [Deltaproteobacteria bacterium]|nr:NAD(P)-dependent oxidoreductase [Deltaproteobacteria bacterium]
MSQLEGRRILVTGPGGQVGFPVARSLADRNEVLGLARFSNPADRERLEAAGVRCLAADLASGDLDVIPEDVDYVLHFAVAKSRQGDFEEDLAANAEGVGRLMARCRRARAFLHCSTTGVYEPAGRHPLRETDPLGDNHRAMLPTYSISKIAAEAVVRFASRQFGLKTTIARLNVPYGDNGGWPAWHLEFMRAGHPVAVHTDGPNVYNPIHEDDIIASIPRLLEIADVPPTIVNWAGNQTASIEEWCAYLGELTGLEPKLAPTEQTISSVVVDTTRMNELVGPTRVHWKDGFKRMVQARHPELLASRG